MSALLEQHPHNECILKGLSNRFDTLQRFLEQVVTVVPIESIIYAIGNCGNLSIAITCRDSLVASNMLSLITPSITLASSIDKAVISVCKHDMLPAEPETAQSNVEECTIKLKALSEGDVKKKFGKKGQKLHKRSKTTKPLQRIVGMQGAQSILEAGLTSAILDRALEGPGTVYEPLHQVASRIKTADPQTLQAVCGEKLEGVFPLLSSSSTAAPIKSPLQILKDGKERLSWLAKKNLDISSVPSSDSKKLSELYNSKMLELVNQIRTNELKICTLLLGAFMEEQVRVPLMKSSLNTAKALSLVTSAAAVGVWAIFSLALGDLQAVLNSIPTQSLLVEVKEYIKGIFHTETRIADKEYAGKLQFMVQSMDNTIGCNSHYVSYSLECQLIELCQTLKINELTPLETLIEDWDRIFKDNILSLVVPTHRSLIASWLKWALMVHNLREELAKYTAIGVVGLVNSGKSLLVSNLFNIRVSHLFFCSMLHACIMYLNAV